MRFAEHGFTKYFERKRYFELKFHLQENIGKKQFEMKTNVTFDDLQFWFIFWICGLIVAFGVFIGEMFISKKYGNTFVAQKLLNLLK